MTAGALPRLLLHVGLPKTASSALQCWCADNAGLLETAGTIYPTGSWLSHRRHQFLVRALLTGGFDPVHRLLGEVGARSLMRSAEGLSNHVDDFPASNLEAFRGLVAGRQVELLMIAREPNSWFESH